MLLEALLLLVLLQQVCQLLLLARGQDHPTVLTAGFTRAVRGAAIHGCTQLNPLAVDKTRAGRVDAFFFLASVTEPDSDHLVQECRETNCQSYSTATHFTDLGGGGRDNTTQI